MADDDVWNIETCSLIQKCRLWSLTAPQRHRSTDSLNVEQLFRILLYKAQWTSPPIVNFKFHVNYLEQLDQVMFIISLLVLAFTTVGMLNIPGVAFYK